VQAAVACVEGAAGFQPHLSFDGQFAGAVGPGALVAEEVGHDGGVGSEGENLSDVADVVAVIMGEEHPPHVGWVDDRTHRFEPSLAEERCAGVDDDGLLGKDDHRVDEHVGTGLGGHQVGDQVRVGRDALWLDDRDGRERRDGRGKFGDAHCESFRCGCGFRSTVRAAGLTTA
jgi:hypothetical protein